MSPARLGRMPASRGIWSILVWAACLQAVLGQESIEPSPSESSTPEPSAPVYAEPANVPPKEEFIRRLYARAAVVGDYVYFDGEEVARLNTERGLNQVNATLSIDLTKSWTSDDVEIIETEHQPDGKQILLQQAILVDQSTESFYAWGGRTSLGEEIRDPPQLWRFQPDGSGKGEWQNATPEDENDAFFSVKRARNTAFASTSDQGFIFGGWTEETTTREPVGTNSGFVSFNFTSKEWKEHDAGPYSPSKTIFGGGAVFAPGFGPNGLVFILGGIGDRDANGDNSQDQYISFKTLHFMDPITKKWYSQETTGSDPTGRYNFCFGGVAAGEDRFDIFIYGGNNNYVRTDYSDVHVLSLPGFHWTAVTNQSNRDRQRREHVCAVVGNRHLLSWGGLRSDGDNDAWKVQDPSPNGVGVFDMNQLLWTNEYTWDAAPYEQNERIKTWYDNGGVDDVTWSSTEVKALFSEDDGNDNGGGDGDRTTEPSPSATPEDDESSNSVPVGAIAGGVVGGVAVIGIIAGVWWFLRRRRRTTEPEPEPEQYAAPSQAEMENTESKYGGTPVYYQQGYQAAPGSPPASELNAGYLPPELVVNPDGTRGRHEVDTQERYEMDGTGYAQGHPTYQDYNR